MPSTKDYGALRREVLARPGAAERLAALREETLAENRRTDPHRLRPLIAGALRPVLPQLLGWKGGPAG